MKLKKSHRVSKLQDLFRSQLANIIDPAHSFSAVFLTSCIQGHYV